MPISACDAASFVSGRAILSPALTSYLMIGYYPIFFVEKKSYFLRMPTQKKQPVSCFFLSPSVMSVMFLELGSSEIAFPELSLAQVPELCLLAKIDHLAAPIAPNKSLFHSYRFTLAPTVKPPCTLRTYIHNQHNSYCQCQHSFRFHNFVLHFNGFNTHFFCFK